MTSDAFDLTGRVAFVTGAAGGLGASIAEHLVAAGATVVGADQQGAAEVSRSFGSRGEGITLDVRDQAAFFAATAATRERHGRLDIMCNVAGIPGNQSHVVDLTEAELDRVLAVNLKGVVFGAQAALRVMIPQGSGSIINMASSAIDVARPGLGPYTMAKAAVAALTKVLATEAGPYGIRVNSVAPGWVETPLARHSMTRPDGTTDQIALDQMTAQMRALSPLAAIGVPADVAHMFVYLASPAAAFVTGQTFRPNGGASMPW
jgi:3-oxoacyl-[acyl-carrier protein] reductase